MRNWIRAHVSFAGLVAGFATGLLAGCGGSSGGGEPGGIDASEPFDAAGDAKAPGDALDAGGGRDAAQTDAPTADGSFAPASHPPLPRVVTLNGPVLTAPKVQPIVYESDTGLSSIAAFLQELTTTMYWHDATSEYGVGALAVLPAIMITQPAPATITDATLQSTLAMNTSGASPAWGAADPSIIYLFVMPQGTIVSDQGNGCTDFDGYHSEALVGSVSVPYAISCACPGFDGPGITDIQERTVDIAHELVEAATDPFPNSRPAYSQEDDADIVWTLVTGGEVADMCELDLDAYYVPPGSTYMIQRSWSNAAAKANTNPCVPNTKAPFFDSFPALTSLPWTEPGGPSVTTQAVNIPVGQKKTIDVTLFSDAPTNGSWTISAVDGTSATTGGQPALTLSFDKKSGKNGDTVHLTIQVDKADPNWGAEQFILFSDFGTQGSPSFQENVMLGLVTN